MAGTEPTALQQDDARKVFVSRVPRTFDSEALRVCLEKALGDGGAAQGGSDIIERRDPARQMRIGASRIEIERLGERGSPGLVRASRAASRSFDRGSGGSVSGLWSLGPTSGGWDTAWTTMARWDPVSNAVRVV